MKIKIDFVSSETYFTLPFIRRRARSNRKGIDSSEKFSDRDARMGGGGGARLDTFNLRQCHAFVRPPYSPFRLVLVSRGEGNPFAITNHLLFRPFRFILVSFGKRRAIRIPRAFPRACNFGKSLIPSIPFCFQPRALSTKTDPFLIGDNKCGEICQLREIQTG